MLSRTSPEGRTWEYTYDSKGNVLTVEDPLTRTDQNVVKETFTYNSLSLPLTREDALENLWEWEYDTDGNLTRSIDPLLYDVEHTYSTAGLRLTTTDARGKVWSWTYDTYGNPAEAEDPLSHVTETTYDILGRPTSVTSATGEVETFTYDGLGRRTKVTHSADSTFIETEFDAEGVVLSVTDENGKTTETTVNSMGWVTAVTDPNTHTTSFGHNYLGQRTSLTNARNKTTTFTLDNAGRTVATTYPDATDESATYDGDGLLLTRTDGRNYTVSHAYDAAGRLTDIDYPTGADTEIQYRADGKRTRLDDRSGTTQWAYNDRGETTMVTRPQGTVSYTFDGNGNRLSTTRTGGVAVSFTYDDASRLASQGTGWSETTSYTRDNAGRVTQQVNPNGTYTLLAYDTGANGRGWLEAIEHRNSSHSTLSRYEYTRSAAGLITAAEQPSVHLVEYTYDDAYQLIEEERTGTHAYDITYAYDAAGNRTSRTVAGVGTESYTYGDNNEILTAGSKSFTHDDNGNLTSVTVGMQTTTLTWDYNNKLTGITYPNSSTNSFVTDDLGYRVSMTDSGGTTSFMFDGNRVLADSRADYVWGGVGGLISERASGTSKYYHADQLGSTRGVTAANETVTAGREYDSFGMTIGGTGLPSPFGFVGGQGYQTDPDSGLMLLGARYYDPSIGRFITRDPIGYGGGINLYSYALNNPSNAIDPTGHNSIAIGIGVGGAIGGPPGAVIGAVIGAIVIVGTAIIISKWPNPTPTPRPPGGPRPRPSDPYTPTPRWYPPRPDPTASDLMPGPGFPRGDWPVPVGPPVWTDWNWGPGDSIDHNWPPQPPGLLEHLEEPPYKPQPGVFQDSPSGYLWENPR